jgi:DNA-binding MarR family transcriptional regulator
METLAVVAYKAPVLQSKVVKIRTNKAYDHLAQLENSGFITREKSGRSKLIKLTSKFFEYFDIDPSKLKQKFSSSGDVEKAIESKEKEIEQIGEQQRKITEERLEKPQIVLDGKPLETYLAVQPSDMLPTGVEIAEDKLGELPVYDVPLELIPPEERPPVEAEHPHHKHHKKKPHKKHPHAVHHPRERVEKPEAPAEVPEEAEALPAKAPVEAPEAPAEVPAEAPAAEAPEAPAPEAPPEVPPEVPVKAPKEKKAKKEKPPKEAPAGVPEIPKVEEEKLEEVPLTPEQKIAKEAAAKTARMKETKFEEGKGLFPKGVPPEVEAKIEEKIKKLLSGEPEEEKGE